MSGDEVIHHRLCQRGFRRPCLSPFQGLRALHNDFERPL
jgi:hypothetical protein